MSSSAKAKPRLRLETLSMMPLGMVMHAALVVAQADVAQGHLLDQPALAGHLDHVALAHLVFQQQEKAVEVVLDQALRAETDGDAEHPGGGEDRRDGNADLGEHQHAADQQDDHGDDIAEHAFQRVQALDPLDVCEIVLQVGAQARQSLARQPEHGPGQRQDDDDMEHDFQRSDPVAQGLFPGGKCFHSCSPLWVGKPTMTMRVRRLAGCANGKAGAGAAREARIAGLGRRSSLADRGRAPNHLLRWASAILMTTTGGNMTIRYLPALLVLLASFSAHAAEPAAPARMGTYYGAQTTEYPDWFKTSFLHLREDVDDARKNGKRVMLMFTQDGCPYCSALVERNLSQREIETTMKEKFDVIAVNIWGDREVVGLDGKTYTEKSFSAALKIQFTPSLLFFDETGKTVLRLNGYVPPARMQAALDWVGGRQEKRSPSAISSPRARCPKQASGNMISRTSS
jgi:thioredoxin-related protein